MKQVPIKEFRKNLAKYIIDLPLEVTKNGQVIARVVPIDEKVYTIPKVYTIKEDKVYTKPSFTFRKTACKKHHIFTCGCPI